jgi:hypothetical protein
VKSTSGDGARIYTLGAMARAEARDANLALAERMAENRFTDMMAAAVVAHDRMALELLFWLPRDFVTLYEELYMRGLANTDGGTEARGRAGAATAAVGKAAAKTAAGQKTYKKYWVIADEDALELKERVDKRLRAMTREFNLILSELDFYRDRRGTEKDAEVKTAGAGKLERGGGLRKKEQVARGVRCGECGVMMGAHWLYCAKCGCPTSSHRPGEG